MNSKRNKFYYFVHGVSITLYLLGFLFLCTVIYFNRFNFDQSSDSKQYLLPFLIMFFSWIFICLTELTDVFLLKTPTLEFRNFMSHHILFILFLGGNYLWCIGAQLFLLNHIIIFLIGLGTSYNCAITLKSYSDKTYEQLETYVIEDPNEPL